MTRRGKIVLYMLGYVRELQEKGLVEYDPDSEFAKSVAVELTMRGVAAHDQLTVGTVGWKPTEKEQSECLAFLMGIGLRLTTKGIDYVKERTKVGWPELGSSR